MEQQSRAVHFGSQDIPANDPFSEQAFRLYGMALRWPVGIAFVVFFILEIREVTLRFGEALGLEMLMFVTLVLVAQRLYGMTSKEIVVVCGYAGFLLGLGLALTRLFIDFAFFQVFNLLAEPAITLVLGLGCGWLFTRLIRPTGRRSHSPLTQPQWTNNK